jgi:hypothetical protein
MSVAREGAKSLTSCCMKGGSGLVGGRSSPDTKISGRLFPIHSCMTGLSSASHRHMRR